MRRGSVEGGAVARASDRSDHKEIVVTTLTMSQWRAHPLTPILETTVGGVLRAAAWRAQDRVALIDGDRRWTYGELLDEAERAARGLLTRFAPGEPVAVWAGNGPDWVLLEFAAGLAGLTLVTVNPAYQAEELAHVLGHCGARGVFLRGGTQAEILAQVRDRLPRLREVITLGEWPSGGGEPPLPEIDPGSPAQILYTSGTTGRPKAAVLTHRGLTNNARLAAEAIGLRAGDVLVNPMPYFHVAGCGLITLGLVQTLGTHVVMARFDPGLALELIEKHHGTVIGGVPTMLTALLAVAGRAGRDLSSLRVALSGGATVPPELVRRVEAEFGVPFVLTFAQTEFELLDHDDECFRCGGGQGRDPRAAAAADRGQDHRRGHRGDRAVRDRGRDLHPRLPGHGRLSRRPGGDCRGDRRRGLAAHRRPRLDGRARLLPDRGPDQGNDHPGR